VLSFAIALTRAWAATYTRGLPAASRTQRREEIDCDLWEHQRLAGLEREPHLQTALVVLLRLIAGIPADIAWRVETGSGARSGKETRMNDSTFVKAAVIIGIALSALIFFAGMGNLVFLTGDWENGSGFVQRVYGLLVALSGAAVIAGLVVGRSKPKLGLSLVGGGSLGTIVLMFWIFMITIPVSAVLVWIAYARAGKPRWPFTGARPSATGSAG
jgi:hypothetical protein